MWSKLCSGVASQWLGYWGFRHGTIYVSFHYKLHIIQFYNPPINFDVILLATLRHVV